MYANWFLTLVCYWFCCLARKKTQIKSSCIFYYKYILTISFIIYPFNFIPLVIVENQGKQSSEEKKFVLFLVVSVLVDEHPVLKADSMKYIMTFRSMVSVVP